MKWFLNTTLTLILIWSLLSGKFDLLHFGVGVLGALLIAAVFYPSRPRSSFPLFRFLLFVPWHLYQVVISNLRVAKLALTPGKTISPTFVEVESGFEDSQALTLLGCAVTLTPGTLTVDIDSNRLLVHALDNASADDVKAGVMQAKVKNVFAARSQG